MPAVLTGLRRPSKNFPMGFVDGARFSIGVTGSSGNIWRFSAHKTSNKNNVPPRQRFGNGSAKFEVPKFTESSFAYFAGGNTTREIGQNTRKLVEERDDSKLSKVSKVLRDLSRCCCTRGLRGFWVVREGPDGEETSLPLCR